jgi:hypothetical protein
VGIAGSRLLVFFSLCTVFLGFPAIAADADAYVPLFVIEKSLSKNVVHYDAKLRNGKIDPEQPVVAYWVMGEDGRRQELNLLERLKAYGFTVKPDKEPDTFNLTIVSNKKKEIRIVRMGSVIRAEAKIGNCDAYLQRIFVATKKSLILSLPEYAEMIGTDVSTGSECHERVTPADR